jgi:hypothetical protein
MNGTTDDYDERHGSTSFSFFINVHPHPKHNRSMTPTIITTTMANIFKCFHAFTTATESYLGIIRGGKKSGKKREHNST